MVAVSCTSTGLFYDPIFASVGTPRASTASCPDGSTCVEVPLTAVVEAIGRTGRCELYTTPGDPETMEPLVREDVEIPAVGDDGLEVAFTWKASVPLDVVPAALNPVCTPMVEG
jgi:hypothetical protein